MKWFFHVGPNKTGTTTIQFALDEARRTLLKKGILYPREGVVNGAHHMLNFSLSVELAGRAPYADALGIKNIPSLDLLFQKLRAEAQDSKADRIIVSSEILWTWGPKKIRRLQELLAGDEAVVVVSVRPHLERELSMWQEDVKHGFIGSPGAYLDTYGDTATSARKLVLTERVENWRKEGFQIQLIPFPSRGAEAPIWDAFLLDVVGETVGAVPIPGSLNVSLDYLATTTLQNALALAIDFGILDSRLAKGKLRPLESAFAVQAAVLGRLKDVSRETLPAYGDFLLEADAEIRAVRYSAQYLNDLAGLLEIAGKTVGVYRFIDDFMPMRLLKTLTVEQRRQIYQQSEMAQELAQEVIKKVSPPGFGGRLARSIGGSTLYKKISRRHILR